ncbi:MAG: metallophosphoesterase family protein [Chloroflexaceae bacterium]|nr:metallophosphoesterase family protein [Chloroflexaceae bacterium]
MRILIISDIHANLVALETVLATAGHNYHRLWCLGDTIGYGPRPNECANLIRERANESISGNHDLACIGDPLADLDYFNHDARRANEWNGKQLTEANREWLRSLTPKRVMQLDGLGPVMLAHGSPRDPIWEYLLSEQDALENFHDTDFTQQLCFIGHSHVPIYYRLVLDEFAEMTLPTRQNNQNVLEIKPHERYIINPGSVGQPRDQDPRAAYAIFDTDALTVTFHRVEYDIGTTQDQMRLANLPRSLVQRLDFGI